jgi:hypothetical protein
MLAFISGNLRTIAIGAIVLSDVFVAAIKVARGKHCDKCGICADHAADNEQTGIVALLSEESLSQGRNSIHGVCEEYREKSGEVER